MVGSTAKSQTVVATVIAAVVATEVAVVQWGMFPVVVGVEECYCHRQ